jgi:sugar O-acyltransferase (sialic acid O-acetyltransferase NeuD family)
MKKALIGAGGFAREVKAHIGDFNMPMFVDDDYYLPNTDNIWPLSKFDPTKYQVVIAIGNPTDKHNMFNKLPKNTQYFTYIHPSAIILGNDVSIGEGSVICAGCVITTNCKLGKHTHLTPCTSIGHDCQIGDFFTASPGARISGNCIIDDNVYFGNSDSVKEKLRICSNVTIGLNAGVVKNITESGVYVGTPAKQIK